MIKNVEQAPIHICQADPVEKVADRRVARQQQQPGRRGQRVGVGMVRIQAQRLIEISEGGRQVARQIVPARVHIIISGLCHRVESQHRNGEGKQFLHFQDQVYLLFHSILPLLLSALIFLNNIHKVSNLLYLGG